jgi:hypothetical protein
MSMLLRIFIFCSGLIITTISLAAPTRPNLPEALKLEKQGRFEESAKQLVPCLGSASLPDAELEECLYVGERVAESMHRGLRMQVGGEEKIISALNGLGIKHKIEHYGGAYYDHDFFRLLAKKFPKSKHSEEFEYVLMNKGSLQEGIAPWEGHTANLKLYLRKFPNGPYSQAARLELGCIYASLWSLLRPDTTESGYRDSIGLSSGDPKRDEVRALQFRAEAIKMYEDGLSYPGKGSLGIDKSLISNSSDTLEALRSKGDAGIGCVISD